MPTSIEELESRITKIERSTQNKLSFFVQYFLSPILVVVIGLIFNWQLEMDRKEIQQIEIAQSMLTTLFSDDEFKSLATKRLMDKVLDDESLKSEIGEIVENFLTSKFNDSIRDEDFEAAQQIYSAAKSIGGNVGKEIIAKIDTNKARKESLTRYEKAIQHEQEGFVALIREDFKSAMENFSKAYNEYSRLHSVAEIHNLLSKNKDKFAESSVQIHIYSEIIKKYSWKVPSGIIQELKMKIPSTSTMN
jgi:tetratricopeptide (TPR) repeat protein